MADLEASARIVIGDWNGGKMKHYATPPGFDPSIMVDLDSLRKELIDQIDKDEDESMMLEEEIITKPKKSSKVESMKME